MSINKYNFVIFGSDFHCYETSYGDVIDLENVKYIPNHLPTKNKFINFLYRIHHAEKINKFIALPFKNIWFHSYLKKIDFEDKKPVCFLFFSHWAQFEKYGFVDFLRQNYQKSKCVCFFQDIISLKKDVNIEHYKKIFDLVITFDHKEAKQYDINYSPLVNSKSKYDLSSNLKETDVYFLGAAKNRLDKIISVYEILQKKKIKCDFYITGVSKEKQKYPNDIKYIDSMSYNDNLKHIIKTKCLLEIMQLGGHGYTQRMVEAIVYNKKIITNNPEIKNAPFYNKRNILAINNVKELISNIIFFENFDREVDHHYKDDISPIRLLEFITKNI